MHGAHLRDAGGGTATQQPPNRLPSLVLTNYEGRPLGKASVLNVG